MAAPGTFTAYRQLKPLQGDVSQDIQNQEELGFQRREEKRRVDNAEQLKIDKDAAKKQALWDKHVKPLSNYDTGSKSLNEIQGRLLLEAQKEYVPLMSVVNNPNASDEDRLKATLKLENINRLPENLMSMTKSLTERDLAVKKGIAEGRLFSNPDYDKNYQEGFGNKLLALDENGMPMIAFKNPDGSTDLETYDQIQNVMKKYDFTQRFDRDKELLDASQKLQPQKITRDDGTYTTVKTLIDPKLLDDYVSNQLFESDGVTPNAKLKSFARDANVPVTDVAGLKSIAEKFKNDISLRVKGEDSRTRNFTTLDSQKENRQAAKDARAEAKDNNTVSTSRTTFDDKYRKDDFNGQTLAKGIVQPNMIAISEGSVPFKNLGGKNRGLNDGYINGFGLDKNGNIVVTGKATIDKGVRKKSGDEDTETATTATNYGNFISYPKGPELNDLITRAGYSSEAELKKELREMNKKAPTASTPKEKTNKQKDLRSKYNY